MEPPPRAEEAEVPEVVVVDAEEALLRPGEAMRQLVTMETRTVMTTSARRAGRGRSEPLLPPDVVRPPPHEGERRPRTDGRRPNRSCRGVAPRLLRVGCHSSPYGMELIVIRRRGQGLPLLPRGCRAHRHERERASGPEVLGVSQASRTGLRFLRECTTPKIRATTDDPGME